MEMETQIKKCTRCGLCAEVCPIYKYTKNESRLARGKFLQLLGVLKGDLRINKKVLHNISFCLNCSKCSDNCPSEINTCEMFSRIKYRNLKFREKFINSKFVFNLKLFPLRFLNPFKQKLFLKKGEMYFKGCLPNYANKSKNCCCGLPYKTSGRYDIYEDMMKKNAELIENNKMEKVYFDCASCYSTVKNYSFKDPKTVEKLQMLHPLSFTEDKIFTLHKPCHLPDKIFAEIENRLFSLGNYVSMYPDKQFDCCGFGGSFFLNHPKIAHKMSVKNARKIISSGAHYVISPCPLCTISIFWGLFFIKHILKENHDVKILRY